MAVATKERELLQTIQDYPEFFFREFLGEKPPDRYGLFPKTLEMINSVRDNFRTSVCGCNSSSKDWTAGRLVLWWMSAFRPAKVVVTGPSNRQVVDIVWQETREAYYSSLTPLGGEMLPKAARWEISDGIFAVGFATDQPLNLQGYHSPHLLIIITEAHQMQYNDIKALERLNPERILMTGNPLSMEGEFYEAFHMNQALYNTIKISAYDTPNIIEGKVVVPGMVTLQDIQHAKDKYGEDSLEYKVMIMGEWPASLEDSLISRAWVDAAVEAKLAPSDPTIVACDVARFGSDKTVMARRDGPRVHIVNVRQGQDLMETAGWIASYLDDHPECEKRVVVDDDGLGGGVSDRLRELGYSVVMFHNGAKAQDDERYFNAIAEAWGEFRNALRDGLVDMWYNAELVGQLVSRRYRIQSDKKIRLEPKDDIKKRGGHSPDEADAICMTFSPLATARAKLWLVGEDDD